MTEIMMSMCSEQIERERDRVPDTLLIIPNIESGGCNFRSALTTDVGR